MIQYQLAVHWIIQGQSSSERSKGRKKKKIKVKTYESSMRLRQNWIAINNWMRYDIRRLKPLFVNRWGEVGREPSRDGHLCNTFSVKIHDGISSDALWFRACSTSFPSPFAVEFTPRDTLMKFKNVNSNLIQICELRGLVHIYYEDRDGPTKYVYSKENTLFENLN